jgi:hypothetical protein
VPQACWQQCANPPEHHYYAALLLPTWCSPSCLRLSGDVTSSLKRSLYIATVQGTRRRLFAMRESGPDDSRLLTLATHGRDYSCIATRPSCWTSAERQRRATGRCASGATDARDLGARPAGSRSAWLVVTQHEYATTLSLALNRSQRRKDCYAYSSLIDATVVQVGKWSPPRCGRRLEFVFF